MTITICGSIAFYQEMLDAKKFLEERKKDCTIKLPPHEIRDLDGKVLDVRDYYAMRKKATENDVEIWQMKEKAIRTHFEKIEGSDAILVLNYEKNDIEGYIGANTLMEMGVAFFLGKKIYVLNSLPQMSYSEEIYGMMPEVLGGKLEDIFSK